jgi:hypothetical protein
MIGILFQHLRKLRIFKYQNKNIFANKDDDFNIEPILNETSAKRKISISNINEEFQFLTKELATEKDIKVKIYQLSKF